MNTRKTLLLGLLLLLIIYNILLNLSLKENKKELYLIQIKLENEKQNVLQMTRDIIEGMEFNMEFKAVLNKTLCDSILNHGAKIFFLFSDTQCKTCILHHLMNLNILANEIGKDKIVIVGDFNYNITFNKYLKNINFGYNSLLMKNMIDQDTFTIKTPHVFVLDANSDVRFSYVMSDNFDVINKLYFNKIIKVFFSN